MSQPQPTGSPRPRPDGISDETVEAVGKLSEAFEYVERARGHLFSFHQLMGHADLAIGEAADALRAAGRTDIATRIDASSSGRNTIDGAGPSRSSRSSTPTTTSRCATTPRPVEDELVDGIPHLFESEMKERRRTHGASGPRSPPARGPRPRVETDRVETSS